MSGYGRHKRGGVTWGDQVAALYRQNRALTGRTYDDHRNMIIQRHGVEISVQWMIKVETMVERPDRPVNAYRAWLLIESYGGDPDDFGLTNARVISPGYDPQ